MSAKGFSLRGRLLFWILGSISVIWVATSIFVWIDAKSEIEELVEKIASNRMTHERLAHEKEEILGGLLRGLIWPLVIGFPVLAIVVSAIIYWTNKSLADLKVAISSRNASSLEEIHVSNLPNEVRFVLDELNTLLRRLDLVLQQEKRFTADAAHELRTPLAAIRTQAEVLKKTKSLDYHAIDNMLESCDRSSRVIDQLLSLAKLDNIDFEDSRKAVNISELVRLALANVYEYAHEKGQQIEFSGDNNLQVFINPDLMGVLLRNLLDNAVRYTANGSKIRASVKNVGGIVNLVVEDSGPGLPEKAHSMLGNRFQRFGIEGASGTGLGWSIIKQIAQIESLNVITGTSLELGGLKVTISYPVHSA